MDLSSILSKEINKKRSNAGSSRLGKRLKTVIATDPEVTSTQKTSDESPVVSKTEQGQKESPNPSKYTAEELELINSITDEQLDRKLHEFNENDEPDLDKLRKVKKLQILTQNENRKIKYKYQLDLESEIYQDETKKLITYDSLLDVAKFKDQLYLQLRVCIKDLIKIWEEELERQNKHDNSSNKLLHETKIDLVKLLYKLRTHKLTSDMLTSLATIIYYIQQKDYRNANESYMKLSIGNVAWPIGVRDVGIHARSADSKIANANSNIMIDDKTRRWITSVKRLITYHEKRNRTI